MKSVIFDQVGMPEDVLKLINEPVPTPKPHEVLVRVTARNINPSDIMFIRGMYGITPKLPSSAGFEACGVVEKSDSDGNLKVGARVMFTALGTWKEYVCVSAAMLIPVPDSMTDEVACQAFINPMTAYGMIQKSGLKKGEWLLITAGASAFGKFAIQMAKSKGINVACTVRHDAQKKVLQELGADLVVNSENEKVQKAIMEKTGEGVSVIFDAVGGVLGARALASLKPGGKMMVFGLLSLENIPMNSGLLIFKDLKIEGFWLTTYMGKMSKEESSEAFKNVFTFLMQNSENVDVAAKFPLESYVEALRAYETAGRNGKVLIVS